jgi:hypothetical protein
MPLALPNLALFLFYFLFLASKKSINWLTSAFMPAGREDSFEYKSKFSISGFYYCIYTLFELLQMPLVTVGRV